MGSKLGRPRINPEVCVEDGCSQPAVAKDRCDKHYRQWRRDSGEIPRKYTVNRGKTCQHEGCDLPAERRLLCSTHYARWLRNGDTDLRIAAHGDGHWRPSGYWVTTRKGKSQHNARHVMEEHLGRALLPGESVHHINGVRNDDRIENLELFVTSHPRGQRPNDLVEWALEILERYEDEYLRGLFPDD